MKVKKATIILILIIGLIGSKTAFAQGGSNYSIFGIGDIYPGGNAAYESLGGTSVAVPSDFAINMRNPAMWSLVKNSRLQAGYRFNQNDVISEKYSLFQNNGKLDGILGIFSVDTSMGISVSFGVHPYSSVNYLVRTENSVNFDSAVIAQTNFNGTGGLSNAYIGGSVNLFNGLSFGASIFATFGLIETVIETVFPINGYDASASIRTDNFFGFGSRVGLFYSGIDNLGIGAFMENHIKTNVSNKLYYTYPSFAKNPISSRDTLIECPDYSVKIPPAFGIGLSYRLEKFLFAADWLMQDFSGFDYNKNAKDTNAPGTYSKSKYKNSMQLSFGISRLGNKSLGAKFLDRINYNIGFGYRELYINTYNNDINEYYISFGMDIPIVGSAMLDFAITLGSRGITTPDLVREIFGRLTVDLSIGEIWFKPYRRQ